MTPWLRIFIGFAEEPAPTWWFTTIHKSSSRGSDVIFWPPRTPGMHVVQIYIHIYGQNPHTDEIK